MSVKSIAVSNTYNPAIAFSICTLVTRKAQYEELLASFVAAGFDTDSCEYLYADNSQSNQWDAYAGLNRLITAATGKYIILCHQDILVRYDKREQLERQIRFLDTEDPNWAILSNTGAADLKRVVYKLTTIGDEYQERGTLPCRVLSVDEHFILLKKEANLGFSKGLKGFHLYGADLCIQAALRGYTAWAVDFHLYHDSKGSPDASFDLLKQQLKANYQEVLKPRFIRTTITKMYLSGNSLRNTLYNTRLVFFCVKQYQKWRKR